MSEDPTGPDVDDLPEQLRVRREKYDRLLADPERAPFPVGVARTTSLAQVRTAHPDLEAPVETGQVEGVTAFLEKRKAEFTGR